MKDFDVGLGWLFLCNKTSKNRMLPKWYIYCALYVFPLKTFLFVRNGPLLAKSLTEKGINLLENLQLTE
jgi:hypothetical protein